MLIRGGCFLDYLLDRGVILQLEDAQTTRSGDPGFVSIWASVVHKNTRWSRSTAVSAEHRMMWVGDVRCV